MLSCTNHSSEDRTKSETSIKCQGKVNTNLLYMVPKVSLTAYLVFKKEYVVKSSWNLKAAYNTENLGVLKNYKCWFLIGVYLAARYESEAGRKCSWVIVADIMN